MAANASGEYRVFKYYEGLCSSADFPKEIAKVLALGVKSQPVRDTDGKIIEEPFILKSKNWDIVYPIPDVSLGLDLENLTTEEYERKILNQVNKISDTVILKTTTTPKELAEEEIDDLTVDSDQNKSSLTMYLEIYKPTYIANPESYPLDCERKGITPKVITKELYEESLRTRHATEEYIYTSSICSVDKKDDTTIGSTEMTFTVCDAYVSKLNNIYGSTSFTVPSTDGNSTSIVVNTAYLTKIKQDDADLYDLILRTLDGGEGIEPKEYSLLNSLTIEITKEGDLYTVIFQGLKKLTTYTIPRGSEFVVQHVPAEGLNPEFYLDGIYIPLDTALYHVDNKRIIFDDTVTFEASIDGLLVIRYTYDTSGQSIISDRVTLLNNHYVLMRLFDNINEEMNGPMDNIYNSSGEIIQTNSHISPWSKLSWYQDFEEVMIDAIDEDVNLSSIHDGTVMVPLETAGLNADTKMRYWINTNNDRFSVIVMGNPSLDYERDRHLVSACYCGKIDSFENSINDTAGNFALFTSSSTEPCNTTLVTEKVNYAMSNFAMTEREATDGTYDADEFQKFIDSCPWSSPCTNSNGYYVQLAENNYFNRENWPKYVIVDPSGKPVTGIVTAYKRNFVMTNGKADILQLTVDPSHIYDETYTIFISFGYYQEKFVINSGVSRDVFGNVIDVDKIRDYGNNTSDGITSIMMYHTRSKAYYQKHHMMFATTEEYMSKVMYGKSSYTGEYYADRIKVTHGNDGPRGTLSDLLVIDSSSLYALDELVINKDFEKEPDEYEETFVYFPITAPYSPLSDSPNARYGLAIKKQEVEPEYADEDKILKIAMDELGKLAEEAWWPVDKDIIPRDVTSNGCNVYWKVLPETAWIGDESIPSDYVPVQLAVINTSEYQGNLDNPILPSIGVALTQGTIKADSTKAYVGITGFEPNTDEKVYYGIASHPINSFGEGAQIKVVLHDGTMDNEAFEYNINGVPFTDEIGDNIPSGDIMLTDAAPDKFLILYSVKEEVDTNGVQKFVITKFSCTPLKDSLNDDNWLLQYPCYINTYIEGGKGTMLHNGQVVTSVSTNVEYDGTFTLPLIPADGYQIKGVTVVNSDTNAVLETITLFETINVAGVDYQGIKLDNVTVNSQIKVTFEPVTV